MGQRKRHHSDFQSLGLRLLFFLEVSSSGVGLISLSYHLLLIPNEG